MLSSLPDVQGLFPGLFKRGQSEAAAEQAARQQARVPHDHGRHVGHERGERAHGRDNLDLSPEAKAAERAARNENESVGDAVAAENASKSLLGQAGGFVRQALETIRQDLGKALKAFGFDSEAVQNFTQAFVEPVLNALKDGANFTAELSFAAFQQVTTMSSNGDFSQSTSLVAQSLSIEVNQDTGEVNVSLAKLSFEQDIRSVGGGNAEGQKPLLVLDPEDLATPQELAAKILASGEAAAETAKTSAPDDANVVGPAESVPSAEGDETAPEEPSTELEETLAQVRERMAEDAVELQTRLTIYSVSTYKNDKGETITKLLLDAQLRISSLADEAPVQEEAESLSLTA